MIELVKSPVVFNEENHTYWLGEKQLQGITSTLIHRAFPDKYKDVAPEILANAARKGSELHALIEYHDNFGTSGNEHEDPRVLLYDRLKEEHGLRTIANEYLVSDLEHYASCIDLVFVNNDGDICLGDIKTTWTLDRQSVALQLSIYKRLFEMQNPGLKVRWLYAIWLPNKDYSMADMACLQPVSEDVIDSLIEADLADRQFDITETYGNLPAMLNSVEDEIIRIEQQMKMCKERQDELKKGLYDVMEKFNVKSFRGSKVLLTRILPTKSESIDSKRLKEERPDIYKEYSKKTTRNGSLKITIHEKQDENNSTN